MSPRTPSFKSNSVIETADCFLDCVISTPVSTPGDISDAPTVGTLLTEVNCKDSVIPGNVRTRRVRCRVGAKNQFVVTEGTLYPST